MLRQVFYGLVLFFALVTTAQAKIVTDILDRDVQIKDEVNRVVLTFYFEEYFSITGAKGVDQIVGWSKKYWQGRRQATWEAFQKKFPKITKIPDVGYTSNNTLTIERIISLNPDVVIFPAFEKHNLKNSVTTLAKAGIPVIFIDFHDEKLTHHTRSIEILGDVFNKQKRAQKINQFYQKHFQVVEDRINSVKNLKRPKVYMEFSAKEGARNFGSTWSDKMWGAMIDLAGGRNIAKGLIKGVDGPLNPEMIIAANPDIIIFSGNYFENSYKNIPLGYGIDEKTARANIQDYLARDGWQNLNAVKNNQVFALYHDLSRHIFDFAGALFIAKAIHPELFEDIDPEQELKTFFKNFYPVPYSGTWMLKF